MARAVGDTIGLGETAVNVWNVMKRPAARPRGPGGGVSPVRCLCVDLRQLRQAYGSLAGVIIFPLWLWITNLALLFGAELDAEIERGRQLQAGIAAEHDIHLPRRDSRVIDRSDAKDDVDIEQGRELRRTRGHRSSGCCSPTAPC